MHPDPLKVLMIEDNPLYTKVVKGLLARNQSLVTEWTFSPDLADGLRQITRGLFDTLLLDLALPDSEGLPTLQAVQRQTPTLPVVVLTATANPVLAHQALQQGAHDFLHKEEVSQERLTLSLLGSVRWTKFEAWKDVPGYEGLYQVSSYGRVKSFYTGDVLNKYNASGFWKVCLYQHKQGRQYYVDQLVAAAFLGACPRGQVIIHQDGVTLNDHAGNLTYDDPELYQLTQHNLVYHRTKVRTSNRWWQRP